jgi:hypothetical protein
MPRPRRDGQPPATPQRRKLSESFIRKLQPSTNGFAVWDAAAAAWRGLTPARRTCCLLVELHPDDPGAPGPQDACIEEIAFRVGPSIATRLPASAAR